MFGKKIIVVATMVVTVAFSASMFAAFEAHVINVTAHIENALAVDPQEIEFGTVFPQEYQERTFTINLSDSFMDEEQTRVKDVEYKIVSKPKCWNNDPENPEYAPVDFATHECPTGFVVMNDLCAFLSKMPVDADGETGVLSYFRNLGLDSECVGSPSDPIGIASGHLEKCLDPAVDNCGLGDTEDCWTVDLKVPPVEGYIAQDWPDSCRDWTVPVDGADYGCDLWVEVTGLSYFADVSSS